VALLGKNTQFERSKELTVCNGINTLFSVVVPVDCSKSVVFGTVVVPVNCLAGTVVGTELVRLSI